MTLTMFIKLYNKEIKKQRRERGPATTMTNDEKKTFSLFLWLKSSDNAPWGP